MPESAKCPVKTIKNYLSHLNLKLDCLFQHPREKKKEALILTKIKCGRFDVEVNELSSRDPPHLTNHCLRGTLVTVLSLVTSFLPTTLRRGTLNPPPATSPTIESKLTTIDLPSTNKRSCLKRSAPSFKAMKTLQLTKRTQQDGSWTYRLQAHPPR